MMSIRTILLGTLPLLIWLSSTAPSTSASELVSKDLSFPGLSGSSDVNGLEVDPFGRLQWWHLGTGSGEGSPEGTLGWMLASIPRYTRAAYYARGEEVGGMASYEMQLYHTSSRGVKWRPEYQSPTSPSLLIGRDFATLPGSYKPGAMAFRNGTLYFAMSSDDLILDLVPRGRFLIHAMDPDDLRRKTAGSSRLVADGSGDLNTRFGRLRKLGFVSQPIPGGGTVDSGIALAENGDLLRYAVNPVPGLGNAAQRIASGITDFAVRHERVRTGGSLFGEERDVLYLTRREEGGSLSRLVTLDPISGVERVVFTAEASRRLTSIGTDVTHLFVAERDIVCTPFFGSLVCDLADGRVRSKTRGNGFVFLTGQEADAAWAVVEDGIALNLCTDEQMVYFSRGPEIRRFPNDAKPIQVDFKPVGLEIVQSVQNLNNSVPLIAGKPTMARGYAQVVENSTSQPGWFVTATLEGRRGETSLGTIQPIRSGWVDGETNLAKLRLSTKQDFLFELPSSWITPGDITLTFTINPGGGAPEQGPGVGFNNHRTEFVQFRDVPPLEVVIHPVEALGTQNYNPIGDPNFPPILARAASLLPVPELRWSFRPEAVTGPYNAPDQDSWSSALSRLRWITMFDQAPANQPPRIHAGAFGYRSPRQSGGNILGLGNRPGSTVLFRVDDEQEFNLPFNTPRSGVTLAHEIGHNLGLKHVDNRQSTIPGVPSACTSFGPDGPFESYTYDGCSFGLPSLVTLAQLSQSTTLPFGFDLLNSAPVRPDIAGDVMSYVATVWTSPYSWQRMIDGHPGLTRSLLPLLPTLAGPDAGKGWALVVAGVRDIATGKFELEDLMKVPIEQLSATALSDSLTQMAESTSTHRIRCLDATGVEHQSYRLPTEPGGEGGTSRETFVLALAIDAEVSRIEIVRGEGGVGLVRSASPSSPVVRMVRPVELDPIAQTVQLTFEMIDVDGDGLRAAIYHSSDGGNLWRLLLDQVQVSQVELSTRFLAGGPQNRFRIVVNDGFNTSAVDTEDFTLPNHSPELVTSGLVDNSVLEFGTELHLEAVSFDAEDGSRPDASISWEVVGNTILVVNSGHCIARDLAPGLYTARATAYDSEGNVTRQTFHFTVKPASVPDSATAPVLDGMLSEESYATAVSLPLPPQGGSVARLIRSGKWLHVGVTGLRYKQGEERASFALVANLDAQGGSAPSARDLRVRVDDLGLTSVETGNGTSFVFDPLQAGLALAKIRRGETTWSLELAVHETLLGGWDHLIQLMLEHDYLTPSSPSQSVWPPDIGVTDVPALWPSVYLGTLPPVADPVLLTIQWRPDGSLRLSWPEAAAGCELQETTDLTRPDWHPVSPAPTGLEWIVPRDAAAHFFRLKCP